MGRQSRRKRERRILPAHVSNPTSDQMESLLFDLQQRNACLLCGGVPLYGGVFIPKDPLAYGAPEGKTRMIRYFLCQKCADRGQQATDDAERKIMAEIRLLLTEPEDN